MPDASPPPLPDNPELSRLLLEIHLRLRQESYDEVTERLARAKAIAPDHPAVLEVEGDLAFAKRRFREAERLFKQAFDADRGNARLEEKYATALVKVHEPEYNLHLIPDDVENPWSYRVARPPAVSGFFSALLPGLGQLHNGDLLKGAVLLFIDLIIASNVGFALYAGLQKYKGQASVPMSTLTGEVFHSLSIPLLLLLTAAWIYSVIDAILVARSMKSQGW